VTTALAQPYGVIFQADAALVTQTPPEDWEAYTCTLAYYTYRVDLSPEIHAFVQNCLERTVLAYPTFASAWALLSIIYLDEFRFRYLLQPTDAPPLGLALDYARRAVEIDPQNARGQQAYMMALYLNGEVDSALRVGSAALAANPNDPDLRREYGVRLALSGDWPAGNQLILEALRRSRAPQSYYEVVIALCAYMQHDYATAAVWVRKSDIQANPLFHLIAAGIFARLGDEVAARREADWLTANAPGLVANIRAEVGLRVIRPQDRDFILEGLQLAGLPNPTG
jgi:tetratricopeptide (TPR) repeat protein